VSPTQGRTPLADVDSAWLRMDDATNLMVVTGVMVYDEPVPFDAVRDIVVNRLLKFSRFRQRVVDDAVVGTAQWEPDRWFSLDYHLVQATFPENGSEAALQRFVSELMSQPLDPRRPLWQFHFIPRYQGGSALITRIHHCIGDGLALIYVMLSMADQGPGGPPHDADADEHAHEPDDFWTSVAHAVGQAVSTVAHVPANVLHEVNEYLAHPQRLQEQAGSLATGAGALGKLLLMPADPHTRFKGPLVAEKHVAWSRPVPVDTLKRVGKATGSTINDVLMSCLAGALRRYLLSRDGQVDRDLNIRGVVPVNLRPLEDAHHLGNQFGLVFLGLPLGIEDPLDRIFEVRKRMNAIKHTPEAYLAFQILRALGLAPKQVFDLVVNLFGMKGTAVVTNVIGPRTPITFAGVKMRQSMFWVPCAGHLGLGVSLLSYAENVWLGVQADAGLIPDPDTVLEGFYAEIEALLELERATHA
jgi:WS/DGAT/MGAT family acyltransferase